MVKRQGILDQYSVSMKCKCEVITEINSWGPLNVKHVCKRSEPLQKRSRLVFEYNTSDE